MDRNKLDKLAIALVFILGFAVYFNAFNVPFHFDDENNLKNNALKLDNFSLDEITRVFSKSIIPTRPVSNFSFALNYYFGGYRVQGYHLVNLLIHILTGVFFYFLVRHTLQLPVNKAFFKTGSSIALFSALVWIVHPLATQSVTYIVQRMNSMSAMFFTLAMWCFAVGRSYQLADPKKQEKFKVWRWYIGCSLSGLLAIGSKEIAATLPFFILLYEWYFHQDAKWSWLKRKLLWIVAVLIIFLAITALYTGGDFVGRIFSNNCSGREFTTLERVLTQFRVLVHYISLIFYPNPNRLALDYDFPRSVSLLSPLTTLFSFVGLGMLLSVAVVLARRERLFSFCIFWFFGNLIIESSVICLEMVFEHRTYLPSMLLILAVVGLMCRFCNSPLFATILLSAIVSIFAYWTFERNMVWKTAIALWSDSVKKYPHKARAYSNLGRAYAEEGEFEHAEKILRISLDLDAYAAIPHRNLAAVMERQGKMKEAEYHYRKAVQLKPEYAEARVGLGGILRERGLYQDAAEQLRQAFAIVPDDKIVNKHLGNCLLRSGNPDAAMSYLSKASAKAPQDLELLLDISEALTLLGQIDKAMETYQRILSLDRSQPSAQYHLGRLLNIKGRGKEAVAHYSEADRLMRYPPEVKYDYANVLFRQGDFEVAGRKYDEFLALTPILAMAYNNKGLLLVKQGMIKEAVNHFEQALRIAPSFQLAAKNLQLASGELRDLSEGEDQAEFSK